MRGAATLLRHADCVPMLQLAVVAQSCADWLSPANFGWSSLIILSTMPPVVQPSILARWCAYVWPACSALLQDLSYYSAPKALEKKKSLDEARRCGRGSWGMP